jgi:phytoene/squalene synthetase
MPRSQCAEIVRAHDYDRYLCTLFAPAPVQEAYFALFAFNHEIAVIAEIVSEEMIGFIRFAWWREALDEIYKGLPIRKHPVVEALANIIRQYNLPRAPFDIILTARAQDLEDEPLNEAGALEEYCRATSSSLLELCVKIAGDIFSEGTDNLGISWAYIGLARTSFKENLLLPELMQLAEQHLANAKLDSGQVLAPFYCASQFYLNRLKQKKDTYSPATRVLLMMYLWWKL